jgi:hypothetical protein
MKTKSISVKELYAQMNTRTVDRLLTMPDGIYTVEKEYQSSVVVPKTAFTEHRTTIIDGEFHASSYLAVYEAKGSVKATRKAIVTKEGNYYYTMEYNKALEAVSVNLI